MTLDEAIKHSEEVAKRIKIIKEERRKGKE